MIISVDQESPVAPYEQLRAQIASMIASGVLPVGERLPSIRQLAVDLDLAPGTVSRAFRELEQDGLVKTRGRHGTFVLDRPTKVQAHHKNQRLQSAAHDLAVLVHQLGADPDDAVAALTDELSKLKDFRID